MKVRTSSRIPKLTPTHGVHRFPRVKRTNLMYSPCKQVLVSMNSTRSLEGCHVQSAGFFASLQSY